jgi:hypothetical protein
MAGSGQKWQEGVGVALTQVPSNKKKHRSNQPSQNKSVTRTTLNLGSNHRLA